jgi:hypothetical protein
MGAYGSSGWSITVGQLRKALDDIPDDYEVMLENADVGDIEISGVNLDLLLPPTETSPGLLVLGGGQVLNYEYGYDERLSRYLDAPIGSTDHGRFFSSNQEGLV